MAESGLDVPSVLVLGHSFVRRLEDFCVGTDRPGMGLTNCRVHFKGFGGTTVERLAQQGIMARHSVVRELRPAVVILQCGGNDLCSPHLSAESIATSLLDLADNLVYNFGVKRVMLCELFPRPSPRYISSIQYMCKLDVVNHRAEEVAATHSAVSFWRHRRLIHSAEPIFANDGVHLSPIGMPKYYKSVRGAIICAMQNL